MVLAEDVPTDIMLVCDSNDREPELDIDEAEIPADAVNNPEVTRVDANVAGPFTDKLKDACTALLKRI